MWFGKNAKQLEYEHLERMKCLERGLPLPDAELAWTKVMEQRGQQLTVVLTVGTLALMGAPVAVTAIILGVGNHLPAVGVLFLLATIWCASAFVLLCLTRHVMTGLLYMKRAPLAATSRPLPPADGLGLMPRREAAHGNSSEGIQTGWFGRPVLVDGE
jgi:hypothetical protein